MTDYEIKQGDQVWVVSYGNRTLRAFNTWQEAKDYVAECRAFDALLDLLTKNENDVLDEHLE